MLCKTVGEKSVELPCGLFASQPSICISPFIKKNDWQNIPRAIQTSLKNLVRESCSLKYNN